MKKNKFKKYNLGAGIKTGKNFALKRVVSIFLAIVIILGQLGLSDVFGWNRITALAATVPQTQISLKRISGSGEGFMYYHFQEITEFQVGTTYALLDDIYEYEEAVCALGSGAVLKITDDANGSKKYIQGMYGNLADVKTYVDVITRGKQFDNCKIGGLYQVPDSGTPAEYRYFCGYGGAQNCGPLYDYSYEQAKLGYENISASLNDIEKQGSTNPSDYTVTISYEGKNIKLDSQSYRVQIIQPDKIIITVEDSQENKIITNFEGPLAIRYDGNAEGVTGISGTHGVWKG